MERDLDPARASARARDSQFAAARRLLPDGRASAKLSQLAELATNVLGVSRAHISLLTEVQTVIGIAGLPPSWLGSETVLSESLCALCANSGRPLVINDLHTDDRVSAAPLVVEDGAASFCAVPLIDEAGNTVGALSTWELTPHIWTQADVTNLQFVARAVIGELELGAVVREFDSTRTRWNLAIDAAGIGSFDWNLRTGQLVWDEQLIAMFGYDGDDRFDESLEAFNARLHPDDVAGVTQALQHAIDTLGEYEAEYRVVLPDGRIRQIQARGRAYGDPGGRPLRLSGAAWDVSTTRIGQSEASNVLEAMPVGHVAVDANWSIVSANAAAETLLGHRRWQLIGHDLWQALPALRSPDVEAALRAVAGDRSSRTIELRLPTPVERWVDIRAMPNENGIAVYLSDSDDRHLAAQLAAEVAEHDRVVAIELQQAMLTTLPEPEHIELRARYLTAAAREKVGGDWYDAFERTDGAVTITVGDVAGHDISAATYMGQLRSMMRAFAWYAQGSPAHDLQSLDGAMRDMKLNRLATCISARLEPMQEHESWTLRWSNAGHLPPILVLPDRTVSLLERPAEPLLGVDPDRLRSEHTLGLPAGSTVLMFTDGLVETRNDSLGDRLAELVSTVRAHIALQLEDLLDVVLTAMVGDQREDDVVILGLRLHTLR